MIKNLYMKKKLISKNYWLVIFISHGKKILKYLIVYIVKSWRIINESKWSGFGLKSCVHA